MPIEQNSQCLEHRALLRYLNVLERQHIATHVSAQMTVTATTEAGTGSGGLIISIRTIRSSVLPPFLGCVPFVIVDLCQQPCCHLSAKQLACIPFQAGRLYHLHFTFRRLLQEWCDHLP